MLWHSPQLPSCSALLSLASFPDAWFSKSLHPIFEKTRWTFKALHSPSPNAPTSPCCAAQPKFVWSAVALMAARLSACGPPVCGDVCSQSQKESFEEYYCAKIGKESQQEYTKRRKTCLKGLLHITVVWTCTQLHVTVHGNNNNAISIFTRHVKSLMVILSLRTTGKKL